MPLSKVNATDCTDRRQRRETRKLRRSGHRKVSVADARLSLGTDPDRKHTLHTSSFEYRAMLFQRPIASPSDFDLVCRDFFANGNQSEL
jgi:hypothetical protein